MVLKSRATPVGIIAITFALLLPVPVLAQVQRVLGLDISAWQGSISQTTWNNIHNVENRQFIILRSSRGGTTGYYNQNDASNSQGLNTFSQRYDDPYYIQNINRVTTAGMFAGSYHFSRPDIIASTLNSGGIANSGTDEADHFIQMAGPWMRPGYLMPVHDLEAGDGARPDNDMAQFCIDFSARIYAVMGIRPAIYINGNYASSVLGAASVSLRNQIAQPAPDLPTNGVPSVVSPCYPTLWSARWPNQTDPNSIDVQNGEPKDSYTPIYGPWDDYGVTHPWKFWQYASTLRLGSYNSGGSNLDADVARGGLEFLKDQLIPAVWMNDGNGDWSTLANWNSGQTPTAPVTGPGQVAPVATGPLPTPRLPGAAGSGVTSGQNDTVILERPAANITVTLSTGTHNIRKLYMRETLNITGGSLTVNFAPSSDSTTNGAQFSGAVTLSNSASFSVHTLQVDTNRTFTLAGGTLTLNTINLMPGATPAKIAMTGDVIFNPLANVTAIIAKGSGSGSSGFVDLSGGTRAFNVGNGTSDVDLSINVPISNGALTKSGAGTMQVISNNTYSLGTTISAGRLLVNNTTGSGTGSGAVIVNGGTLGGTGIIADIVTVNSGGTISPGASIGTMTLNSAPVFSGTNFMEIDRNGGSPLADRIVLTSGTLNYGGTLTVTNVGAGLVGGEVFTLFTAPAYSSAFANSNLPPLSAGLNWFTSALVTNGTIKVNRKPVVNGVTSTNTPGQTLPIPIASLIGSATDADGDSLALTAFDPVTTNGIALSSDSTYLYYSNGANVADRFNYTISDGHGGSATGAVQIVPSASTAPSIASGPESLTVIAGQNATLSVSANGSAPLGYQWRFNGANISSATDSAYTRLNAQTNHAGQYSVVVTNSVGSITSAPAVLTVNFSLIAAATIGGSVGASPNQSSYAPNFSVNLTAVPDANYFFAGWTGDASGTNNPLNVTMTTNKTITATFLSTLTDIILDNTNAEVTFSGDWQTGTSSTDKYLADYRFASTFAGGLSNATYRPAIGTPGYYDVSIWYPQGGNRATNAPWTVVFDGGSTNVPVDQTTNGGGWVLIAAARPFQSGTSGFVRLSNDTGYSGKVVLADAVRFTFVAPFAAPAITCPSNVSVQCYADVPAPNAATVQSSSACGPLTNSFVSDSSLTNGCVVTITRTYRAADACGHSSDCVQTIIVHDTTPPTITCPSNTNVQSFADIPSPDTNQPTASDNCGGPVSVTFVGDDIATNGNTITVTRTYRATDACGNTADCSQTISAPAGLSPAITAHPQSQTVKGGTNVTFTVTATGTPSPTYQWCFNGTNISGATDSSYMRGNVQTNDAGNYSVALTNLAGWAVSSNATLAVTLPLPFQFQFIERLADGRVHLIISGEPGESIWLDRASNFVDWEALTNLVNTNGTMDFIDTGATNFERSFYRTRQ